MDEALMLYREVRSRMRPLRGGLRDVNGAVMALAMQWRWDERPPPRPHTLPAALVVSITSYTPRFATLANTLKCLLSQSVSPDRVVLWVARHEMIALPAEVLALRDFGLDIEPTDDIGSFKKIIPALRRFPHAFIAIADDDVYYAPHWLQDLTAGWSRHAREIPCQRVHQITFDEAGAPLPYLKWSFAVRGSASPLNVATGVGGVLYPPGSLHDDVLDQQQFLRLCPTSDDLWLYWMARRAGWCFRQAGAQRFFHSWPRSQNVALQHINVVAGGGNDRQFRRLLEYFGAPYTREDIVQRAPAHAPGVRPWRTPPAPRPALNALLALLVGAG